MNLSEIRGEAWDIARDFGQVDEDRLWTKREMNRYINRVYKRIASETKCIRDNTTPSVCLISTAPVDYTTYATGTLDYIWANDTDGWLYQKNVAPYVYTYHSSIIQIDEVKWSNRTWRLMKVSCTKWQTNPWWEKVVGMPTEYCTDLQNGAIALNYRDEETDTLQLHVRRMPLVDLVDDNDIPEIRVNYHEFFLNGVLAMMFSKQDAEAFDGAKYNAYEQKFLKDLDEIKQEESQLDYHLRPNSPMKAFY
jgi:hypothetical protein